MADGISRTGRAAERLFIELTGFQACVSPGKGDAAFELDGVCHYIEVKKCSSNTINQVRPIKFIPLVVYDERDNSWYVIDPVELVAAAAARGRGQHTEVPFESMTLNISNWYSRKVDAGKLRSAVEKAIHMGLMNAELARCMSELRDGLVTLSDEYKQRVLRLLSSK